MTTDQRLGRDHDETGNGDDRQGCQQPRGRGRPRNDEIDASVAGVVWELLDEIGYHGLTIDAVAERAGCSRPALYRRWPNKRAMVLSVLDRAIATIQQERPVSERGEAALYGWLRGLIDFLSGTGRGALLSLAHGRRRDPELAAALDAIMSQDRENYLAELGALLGSDVPAARLHRIADVLVGTVFFRVALQDSTMSDDELRMLIAEQLSVNQGP